MRVYDLIVEQEPSGATAGAQVPAIESWSDLRTAFSETQWRNIILHFLKPSLERAASVEDREYQIQRAMETIGPKANVLSPVAWYTSALNYDIRFPKSPNKWNDIYTNLKPHATTEVQLKPAPASKPLTTTREETLEVISGWVKPGVDVFTDDEQLTKYVQDWLNVLKTKRSKPWVDAYNDVGKDNTNQARRAYKSEMLELLTQFKKDKEVPKKEVDIRLFSILKTMDTVINNYIRNKPASS